MQKKQISDRQLVNAYMEGDLQSMEFLIRKYKDRVYTYILTIVKNTTLAEDIFQETFIKVINSLNSKKYEERGSFLSWVLRIAHNLIIDYFRKNKTYPTISNDDSELDIFNNPKFSERTIEEDIIKEQIKQDVKKILLLLPVEQRNVVMLRHYWGLSFKEIAEITGVSINTALGRMRYALINLRKIIQKNNIKLKM